MGRKSHYEIGLTNIEMLLLDLYYSIACKLPENQLLDHLLVSPGGSRTLWPF